jgi:hypothetical protein
MSSVFGFDSVCAVPRGQIGIEQTSFEQRAGPVRIATVVHMNMLCHHTWGQIALRREREEGKVEVVEQDLETSKPKGV